MKRIFISYARADKSTAERLYDDLREAGFEPWLDERDLLPGQNWELETINAIHQAGFFIALLSNHSISHKGFVQKEIREALEVLDQVPTSEAFVIPARLEECYPNEPRLRKIHWVDFFPEYRDGIGKLTRALRQYLVKDALTEGRLSSVRALDTSQVREFSVDGRPIIIHIEDEKAYEYIFRHRLGQKFRYLRVSLLSEAAEFLASKEVGGFIVDLRLPDERLDSFSDWGDYEKTSIGLILKIRSERPELPVVVLTNYSEDPGLRGLLRHSVLEQVDVFNKVDLIDDEVIEYIMGRLGRK